MWRFVGYGCTCYSAQWRAGKHGVYLAKHNDRQFDLSNATHIDAEKSADNVYWSYYDGMTFEDCERKYYDARFGPALNLQNEKYAKRRQYVYMRTMDEYIANEDTCPEETVIYIGNKDEHVGIDLLKKITTEQIEWERKTYPNVVILDVALHVDEEGAPHFQRSLQGEADHDRPPYTRGSEGVCPVDRAVTA